MKNLHLNIAFVGGLSLFSFTSLFISHAIDASTSTPVLANLEFLKKANIQPLAEDSQMGVGYARLTLEQERQLSQVAHASGRCGGFEAIEEPSLFEWDKASSATALLKELRFQVQRQNTLASPLGALHKTVTVTPRAEITQALEHVRADNIRQWVEWFSSFPTRYNRSDTPNRHVVAFQEQLEKMAERAAYPIEISTIQHNNTPQDTLRVRIEGTTYPEEIIVLGGHMDSINQSWWGKKKAPGADDNASGSSNLLEALRILLAQPQPERSIEFFWYAGEESGLLGSTEIAKDYKNEGKDVVAALQLDMTLHPGSGELVIANISDFTNAWLREYFVSLNNAYIGARLVDSKCGYGCSDHASWFRRGYATLMPFEAHFNDMNRNIHTESDVINNQSSFEHSAAFAKIALAFAMDLGNSRERPPSNK